MAPAQLQKRRLLAVGGFAVAVVAGPAFVDLLADSEQQRTVPLAACAAGEEPDHFTGQCVPHTVPNSPATAPDFQSIPGNPNIPAVELPGGGGSIPCAVNIGQCIALSEVGNAGPPVAPESHVESSPTVHGRIGP